MTQLSSSLYFDFWWYRPPYNHFVVLTWFTHFTTNNHFSNFYWYIRKIVSMFTLFYTLTPKYYLIICYINTKNFFNNILVINYWQIPIYLKIGGDLLCNKHLFIKLKDISIQIYKYHILRFITLKSFWSVHFCTPWGQYLGIRALF